MIQKKKSKDNLATFFVLLFKLQFVAGSKRRIYVILLKDVVHEYTKKTLEKETG